MSIGTLTLEIAETGAGQLNTARHADTFVATFLLGLRDRTQAGKPKYRIQLQVLSRPTALGHGTIQSLRPGERRKHTNVIYIKPRIPGVFECPDSCYGGFKDS